MSRKNTTPNSTGANMLWIVALVVFLAAVAGFSWYYAGSTTRPPATPIDEHGPPAQRRAAVAPAVADATEAETREPATPERAVPHRAQLRDATAMGLVYAEPVIGDVTDSDLDGLLDSEEDTNQNGIVDFWETDPRNWDTDGDGWGDGVEVKLLRTDPLDPNDPGELVDNDGDGLPSLIDPDDNNIDTDSDRITDGYEAVTLGLGAVQNPHRYPPIGDLNDDGAVSNIDALITQAVFLDRLPPGMFHPERGDVNGDGEVGNIDALHIHTFFMYPATVLPATRTVVSLP